MRKGGKGEEQGYHWQVFFGCSGRAPENRTVCVIDTED